MTKIKAALSALRGTTGFACAYGHPVCLGIDSWRHVSGKAASWACAYHPLTLPPEEQSPLDAGERMNDVNRLLAFEEYADEE